MAITSLAELRVELLRLIDGDDAGSSSVPVATINRVIELGQRRIYRDVRCRHNERTVEVIVSDNEAALPSDFVSAKTVSFGGAPLEPVSDDYLLQRLSRQLPGNSERFALVGDAVMFEPTAQEGQTCALTYWARLADLTDANLSSNTLFQAADDLFIYAALLESAPFFGQDARMPLWQAKYAETVDTLNKIDRRAGLSGGPLRLRPSALGMRCKPDYTPALPVVSGSSFVFDSGIYEPGVFV